MSSTDNREIDQETGTETTGHEWDGIKELNNPLPRWWLWTFYLTIIWGIGYTVAYPAWPLVSEATAGMLGFSTRANVAADIAAVEEANAPRMAQLEEADLATLAGADAELHRFATSVGAAVFRQNCSTCHGAGAAGAVGYPNLLDDDWLWGGEVEQIAATVRHGIRNDEDMDALWSQMPAFDEILTGEEIDAVVQHVMAIAGAEHDAALAATGAEVFAGQCAACHGDDGAGNRDMGAPNLTDAIWLYGGDAASLEETIRHSRFGVMPNWSTRLSEAEIRAVATYVHQLGGGE